jgi:spermidine/putrescine transport system substrate-binding protein
MNKSRNRSATPEVSTNRRRFLAGAAAATAAISVTQQAGAQADDGTLRLYSWRDYTGKSTLQDFTAESGISASADFYDSSDEMFRTISRGADRYDLLIASYDYVEEMIGNRLLLPLDHSKIPNIENLFPVFRDARFDPGLRYSMPYLWGTQGICYRKSAVNVVPDSWGILLDSNAHSGRIALPGRDTIGLALKYLGYSYNSVDPDQLAAAGALLIRQKPHVRSFFGSNAIELLANGDVDLTVGWNNEVLGLMEQDDDIGYRVPTEGGLLWQDCLCIPSTAANPAGAHKLINYALEADTGASIARNFWYATPNRAAVALLPDGYRTDPVVFPGMDIIKRCEPALNLGKAGTILRDQTWLKVSEA